MDILRKACDPALLGIVAVLISYAPFCASRSKLQLFFASKVLKGTSAEFPFCAAFPEPSSDRKRAESLKTQTQLLQFVTETKDRDRFDFWFGILEPAVFVPL